MRQLKHSQILTCYRYALGKTNREMADTLGFSKTWLSYVESGRERGGTDFWDSFEKTYGLGFDDIEQIIKKHKTPRQFVRYISKLLKKDIAES